MPKLIDLTDQIFGRLTVTERAENDKYKHTRWLCQCTCGNHKIIRGDFLLAGTVQSCGCLVQDWKGASCESIHRRIVRDKPKPELCERCKEKPPAELSYDHSLTEEQRSNPNAYEWLCKSCHRLKDLGKGTIITKKNIYKARRLYACSAANQRELADLLKVSKTTIANIIHYRGAYI